jgi:hypothetical protein
MRSPNTEASQAPAEYEIILVEGIVYVIQVSQLDKFRDSHPAPDISHQIG